MKRLLTSGSGFAVLYTVVKWGHTEGIPREKTLSQKYTVIALDFWRDEFFLVFQIWGQNIIGGQFLGHYHPRAVYPQILQAIPAEGNALIFWFFYMQKINAKCPQISDEKKTSFAPLINNFLIIILKNQKLFVKEAKLFFSSEIWGHFAFTFCRYLNQNMRAFKFCRYCLQNLFLDAI